jgi:hypothetical protein
LLGSTLFSEGSSPSTGGHPSLSWSVQSMDRKEARPGTGVMQIGSLARTISAAPLTAERSKSEPRMPRGTRGWHWGLPVPFCLSFTSSQCPISSSPRVLMSAVFLASPLPPYPSCTNSSQTFPLLSSCQRKPVSPLSSFPQLVSSGF